MKMKPIKTFIAKVRKSKLLKPLYHLKIALRLAILRVLNLLYKKKYLNVGGGPKFIGLGWINLEEITSFVNPRSFKLSPKCKFPLNNSQKQIVYTSHCIEHLDNKTVSRVFSEAHRVLNENGDLLVKIPDYDQILKSWKKNDLSYFSDEMWSCPFKTTWKAKKVRDNIDSRAAMLFCGFWNREYGNIFDKKNKKPLSGSAYCGPPIVDNNQLKSALNLGEPSKVAKKLKSFVINKENDYYFNHQSAWGRKELKKLLALHGFEVKSFDEEFILDKFSKVPTIFEMKKQSIYCWAKKVKSKNKKLNLKK